MPRYFWASLEFVCTLMHLGSASGSDVLRGRQQIARHTAPRPALVQTRNGLVHGVGPEFLGNDGDTSKDVSAAADRPPLTSVDDEEAASHTGQLAIEASEAVAAVQASNTKPPSNIQSGKPKEHSSMHLLSTEKADAHDVVSVRFDHVLDNAKHVMNLVSSGVIAGAEAAIVNVVPSEASSWLTAADATVNSSSAAPVESSSTASSQVGAMTFFSGSARAGTSNHSMPKKFHSSLLALAVAKAEANANTERMDESGARVDVLAPRTMEDQQQALLIAARQQEQRAAEASRVEELERQGALEEAMDSTRAASGWGIRGI